MIHAMFHNIRKQRWLGLVPAALSLFPLVMTLANMRPLARLSRKAIPAKQGLSVLIPARNESRQIRGALDTVLENGDFVHEVIVLDDHSSDDTLVKIQEMTSEKIRIIPGSDLPAGWCGKSHACAQLARNASQEWLLFLDADVRLMPDAISRLMAYVHSHDDAALVSGVPRQETRTFLEWLLLPFINALLFGYLPLRFDTGRSPALAAACGQLVLVKAAAYRHAGGHEAIRKQLHDGLSLARLLRRHGYATKLIDATDIARCRMYRSAGEVYVGLMKNAVEGLAGSIALPIWTTLLAGGHILPFIMRGSPVIWFARLASLVFRLIVALRCKQSILSVLFSPVGTFVLLWIQFHARVRHLVRRPVTWKGRYYET